MWLVFKKNPNMFTLINPVTRYLCSFLSSSFIWSFFFSCALPCSQFIPPFIYLFLQFSCIYVWDLYETSFALVAAQNKKNWTLFPGWSGSPLFVPCPLFLLLPIWHYLANSFVVIPSLFNSVFVCLFYLSWCLQRPKIYLFSPVCFCCF